MAKITDPRMEPYYIGKDTYCYTVYEVVTPQEKNLEKGSEGKNYEKPVDLPMPAAMRIFLTMYTSTITSREMFTTCIRKSSRTANNADGCVCGSSTTSNNGGCGYGSCGCGSISVESSLRHCSCDWCNR